MIRAGDIQRTTNGARSNSAFFSKNSTSDFFGKSSSDNTFFSGSGSTQVQPKLEMGQPGDAYEQEADLMADQVVQRETSDKLQTQLNSPFIQSKCADCEQEEKMQKKQQDTDSLAQPMVQQKINDPVISTKAQPEPIAPVVTPPPLVQSKCADCQQEEKVQQKEEEDDTEQGMDMIQRKPVFDTGDTLQKQPSAGGMESSLAPQTVESKLSSTKGLGSALPDETRSQMESSFGSDLSPVRVHTDSAAVQMSKDLNAQAFTHGNDIYFNAGKYDPVSSQGKHLLAHELTHTVQQKPGAKIQKAPNGDPKTDPNVAKGSGGGGATGNSTAPGPTASGPNPARLLEGDKSQPSMGPAPLEYGHDIVFTLFKSKELMSGYEFNKSWDFIDADFTLFNFPTEIGVVISLGGGIHAGAKFGFKVDPLTLRNLRVGLTKDQLKDIAKYGAIGTILGSATGGLANYWAMDKILKGHYWGDATLDFGAEITGSFNFDAELHAEASFAKLFRLAVVKAGISAGASAAVRASAKMPIQIEFKNGHINFEKSLFFESDFLLNLFLKAYLEAQVLGWKFNLGEIGFEKQLSATPLAFTLGTPVKLNSENGKPKTEIDVPMVADKVKKFMNIFKDKKSNILQPEKGSEEGEMGEPKPPTNVSSTGKGTESYDSFLGVYLANERRRVAYKSFDDFKGTNIAVFKYKIYEGDKPDESKLVKTDYEPAPNVKGSLHSEAQIIGTLHKLHRDFSKGKTYLFKVTQLVSERKPCISCSGYLRTPNPLVSTRDAEIFYLVPWVTSPHRAYLEAIRDMILKYGMKPPTVDEIIEKEQQAKQAKKNTP